MSLLTRTTRLPDHGIFKDVKPDDITFVEIFPPIGVARFGDSRTEYFIGPELPLIHDNRDGSLVPTEDNKFRDHEGKIRRQAARFRVYAYDEHARILGELNEKNGYTLSWSVHVVNKKAAGDNINTNEPDPGKRNPEVTDEAARKKLIVDPGVKTITRTSEGTNVIPLKGRFQGRVYATTRLDLGQLQVDDFGRLVFIGGPGDIYGKKPRDTESLNNLECVDDACDGWVDVAVSHQKRMIAESARHKATVLCGPPKYPWDLRSVTSIHDLIENAYQKPEEIQRTDFNLNVWPVLEAPALMSWTDPKARKGHGPGAGGDFLSQRTEDGLDSNTINQRLKRDIFKRLKLPGSTDWGRDQDMPALNGGATATLTAIQYRHLELWKDHKFDVTEPIKYDKLEDVPLKDQPKYLTRANLEMTVGGSFFPGIEACNRVKDATTYDLTIKDLDPPYRVNVAKIQPGDLTEELAVPWQADFDQCDTAWWPAARPNIVRSTRNGPPQEWNRGAEGAKMLNS